MKMPLKNYLKKENNLKKDNKLEKDYNFEKELVKLAEAFPLAKGCLSAFYVRCRRKDCQICATGNGHVKYLFVSRDNGLYKGLIVKPEHVKLVRLALENGRAVERFMAENGRALVLSLRGDKGDE